MNALMIIVESEQAMLAEGEKLAQTVHPGMVVALEGDLGAGKTVLTRGIACGLGVTGDVTSPTFTLIHEHHGRIPLYHMDLYRLGSEQEIMDIGIEDYFYGDGVCVVEWAEKLGDLCPEDALWITIRHAGDGRRELIIKGR